MPSWEWRCTGESCRSNSQPRGPPHVGARMATMRSVFLLVAAVSLASCSRPAGLFVEQNARAHINMLAGAIGSRPAGTPANDNARAYIVDQLTFYGFTVRVQETDARRAELGRTARVSNIIAILPGERPEAV